MLKLLTYLWKYIGNWKGRLAVSLACLTFVTFSNLLYPWLLKLMVDKFNGGEVYGFQIGLFTAVLAAVFILSSVLGYVNYVIMQNLGNMLRNTVRSEFYSWLLYREMNFYKDHQIGELSSRATEDIARLQPLFLNLIAPVYQNLLFITGCIAVMMMINPFATLIVIALILLIVPVILFASRKIRAYSARAQQKHSDANAYMEETLIGIREIKSFVLEKIKISSYTEKINSASNDELDASKLHAGISHTIQLVLSILVVGVFYAGTAGTFSKTGSMGSLVAFYFYAYSVTLAFVSVGRVYLNYQVIRGATHRIIEMLSGKSAEEQPQASVKTVAETINGKVEFRDVTFAYNKDTDVLKNLSFSADAGQWLLITGPSGCGKSTIANLLLGFYSTDSGEVLIDGKSINDTDIYSLRRQIGFAAQEPVLFHGSIKENICFSQSPISENRFNEILKITCIDTFITELPEGANTIIGERGITLSGGQRARIAIARAIAFEPPVLILDEANAMIEAGLEKDLWKNLEQDRKGKTTIILSHHIENIPAIYKQLKLG